MSSQPGQIILIVITAIFVTSCSAEKSKNSLLEKGATLNDVIQVISPEFFSGNWKAVGAVGTDGRPLILSINMKKREIQENLPVKEVIEEYVPVDSGYALLIYIPDRPETKGVGGLRTIIVLKRIGNNAIAMIQEPGLVSLYVRTKQDKRAR